MVNKRLDAKLLAAAKAGDTDRILALVGDDEVRSGEAAVQRAGGRRSDDRRDRDQRMESARDRVARAGWQLQSGAHAR